MLATASIVGRAHRLRQQNCHDFAQTCTTENGHQIGLVLDGCGSKFKDVAGTHVSQNEVGAKLLGAFVIRYLAEQLTDTTPMQTIENLYDAAHNFLTNLLDLYAFDEPSKRQFVYTNLLCTMVGFVMKEDTAVFFWRGDGWLIHNDTLTDLNANNHPDYLAYDLFNERKGLHTKTVTLPEIHRIGVATDGWDESLLTELTPQKNEIMLQRWVNVQAKQAPNFEDDAAIAIYWNMNHAEDEGRRRRGEKFPSPQPPIPDPQPPTS